jgi:hypothetical protein
VFRLADVVIINRPELRIFNTDQPYEAYLKQHFFRLTEKFPGFEVWAAQ